MYISSQRYILAQITQKNLAECAKLLADSFFNKNPTWKTLNCQYIDILNFMVAKVTEMVDWQNELRQQGVIDTPLNFAYVGPNDEIVGVFNSIEMTQYLSRKSSVDLKEFKVLQKYGAQLQKSILNLDKVPGLTVYCMFYGIKPSYIGTNLSQSMLQDVGHHLHSKGFRLFYSRFSNPKSFSSAIKLGGHLTSKITLVENGKQINLYFAKWYLDPFNYTKHYIKASL